jgi:hypothetical protein
MAEAGFWPLYQDAHIHQHVLEFKPFMRWVSLEAHDRKYGGVPTPGRKLVLRDRGRNTDERMVVAAVLPPRSCFGHSLNGIEVPESLLDPLCVLLNTLCFDFLARQKNSGLHVSPYILRLCAVPPPALSSVSTTIEPMHAPHREMWIYDCENRWPERYAAEASVAREYGLSPGELAHILGTFPVFRRKRAAFVAFLERELSEERLLGSPQ